MNALQIVACPLCSGNDGFSPQTDYPLIAARGITEAGWLKDSLVEARLIDERPGVRSTSCVLTMKGWEYLIRLRQEGPRSTFVFVAMSFNSAMGALFEDAIEPAVRQAGYEPIRVDRKEHANSIDDEIIGNIRKSRHLRVSPPGKLHRYLFKLCVSSRVRPRPYRT